MSSEELRKTFFEELKPQILQITKADGYEPSEFWNFAMGTKELKFNVY